MLHFYVPGWAWKLEPLARLKWKSQKTVPVRLQHQNRHQNLKYGVDYNFYYTFVLFLFSGTIIFLLLAALIFHVFTRIVEHEL